jgi:Aerotolerance regulator N-terminal/von Willebrand factor type A domain
MNFLAPGMLFGAAAVAIPIALHFFFRARHRVVPWAAMKFLLESIEQTSRRLRFQELLLLLTRCAVLALLAFAMARPMTAGARGTGRGDAVDAVFVIDTSFSMGASEGAVTRFELEKNTALKAIEMLPPHSTVQIVSSSDRASLLGPRSPSNLDQARELVKNLEISSLSTDFAPALVEAKKVFERGQLPNKELYFFSDFQKSGFEQQPNLVVDTLKDLNEKTNLMLVRCGSRTVKNAAIVGITAQSGIPRPGQRAGFAVLVRNTGSDPLNDIRLTLTADGDDKNGDSQTIATLDGNETRAVTMSAKFDKIGPRVLSAKIVFDELDGDNRYDQVIPVREQVNILVVNGNPNDRQPTQSSTFFLDNALMPTSEKSGTKSFIQFRDIESRLASPALLAKTDLCFLVNVGMPGEQGKAADGAAKRGVVPADFLSELAGWVRQGHGLVIIPGSNSDAGAYNRELGKLGLLPTPIKQIRNINPDNSIHLSRSTFDYPAFRDFKTDKRYSKIDEVKTWHFLELDDSSTKTSKVEPPPPSGEVLARFENRLPFLTLRRVDAGQVVLFATAFEPTWSDLPIIPPELPVPLIQSIVSQLLHGQTQNHNLVAGEGLTWYPQEKEPQNYSLRTPSGSVLRLGLPITKDGRQVLSIGDLDRAGVYRLMTTTVTNEAILSDTGDPIAVTPDLREVADLSTLTDEQIDARLGFRVSHVDITKDTNSSGIERYRREWTLYVLAAVLALAVFESVLAFFCGKSW